MKNIICSVMKHKFQPFLLFLAILPFFHCSHSQTRDYLPVKTRHFFHELHIKGYEQMSSLIEPWIEKAGKINQEIPREIQIEQGGSPEIKQAVQEALIIALSKPGHDNTVSRLVQNIQRRTGVYSDFWSVMDNISKKACSGVKSEDRSPLERATYFYILENIISELRPYVENSDPAKNILSFIQHADIKIPPSVHSERYIRVLEPQTLSPSKLAKKVLNQK